jgi:hypothetical protein
MLITAMLNLLGAVVYGINFDTIFTDVAIRHFIS